MSNLIVICPHLFRREHGAQVIHVEGGKVLEATCFDCADAINTPGADIPAVTEGFRPICPGHAQAQEIPTEVKMADGFYEWEDGRWVKQPDTEDAVN